MTESTSSSAPVSKRARYVPAVTPRLRMLLSVVLGLFALLAVNGIYLASVTAFEWSTGATYQNYFYLLMFLGHLVLGALLIVPLVVFGVLHIKNSHDRPNRIAVRVGYALFALGLVLVASGVVLTRIEGIIEVKDPAVRSTAYWLHVLSPIAVVWLFILHRLAGPRIRWKVGIRWGAVAGVFAAAMVLSHSQDPKAWNVAGPESGEQYFFPSLARTADGNFIDPDVLMNDGYCLECHEDSHASWMNSAHRFSSFNNPAYLFSVRETRRDSLARDGNVQAARFCAGCHDPAPFFTGAFDDPDFDDVNHPTAMAGITCTSCHAITHVNGPRGNSDYTIEEPSHYPFAFSDNRVLGWLNRQLVKAKPEFHKKTFLKPLHKTAEFCGSCHKVHLPEELNHYKWLRGQNHYDAYHLSGVSGHGITSWYYPPKAKHDCNGCHMPTIPSSQFGAQDFDGTGELVVHDHMFPSSNTGIAHMVGLGDDVIEAHRAFLEDSLRIDFFGIKEGGEIDGELTAPLRPNVPELVPGQRYLLETVLRTLTLGHLFTQGTADSNEVWVDIVVRDGERVIGRSGGQGPDGDVDPWSHFVNAYVLDREGNRIDRRNAEDIFVPLYNHQIPPGAADVVHFAFDVPEDVTGPIEVEAHLRFRKFDTLYLRYIHGDEFDSNDLPIVTICSDTITFPVAGSDHAPVANEDRDIPVWQRWNDYGIALFRKGNSGSARGELRQAEAAFSEVAALGRPDGPLNRARVAIKEGRLDDAVVMLQQAAAHVPPAPQWSVSYFTGVVNAQNGFLDEAIENLRDVVTMDTPETRKREFDFSQDYRLLNELAELLFERSRLERGDALAAQRDAFLDEATELYESALALDPENATAHYGLAQISSDRGDIEREEFHRAQHARYKPDDNARDAAVAAARRRDAAANHAAEAIVIYDLQRDGAYELSGSGLPSDDPIRSLPREGIPTGTDAAIGATGR